MKKKILFFLFLVIVFILFIVVKFVFFSSDKGMGVLKVDSSPIANVFINNTMSGKTPLRKKISIGEYIVKLIPEGVATDTASWEGKVKVEENTISYVNIELGSSDLSTAGDILTVSRLKKYSSKKGEILIETDPEGAIISLDNDEKGISPLILKDVVEGAHEISAYLPGFLRRTESVNVIEGFRTNIKFKLAIDEAQQKKENVATEEAPLSPNPEKESSSSAKNKEVVKIKETSTGWLRVREEPSITSKELTKVKPGEEYTLLDKESTKGWYKIEYEKGKEGWVSSRYVSIISSSR